MDKNIKSDASVVDDEKLDPVAVSLLSSLSEVGIGKAISPETVARTYAETRRRNSDPPDIWRCYLNAVRQQAKYLARKGHIEILRKGKPVDPNDFKGVYRLRLKVDEP
tara:strand:- start:1277 stop:1600 length:324 start_codon:yes stop_codon:yes gene_type:complete